MAGGEGGVETEMVPGGEDGGEVRWCGRRVRVGYPKWFTYSGEAELHVILQQAIARHVESWQCAVGQLQQRKGVSASCLITLVEPSPDLCLELQHSRAELEHSATLFGRTG